MTATISDASVKDTMESRPTFKRRGLIAGAAVLAADIAAKQAAQPVAAAANMQIADTTTSVTNTAMGETTLFAANGFSGGVLLTLDVTTSASGATIIQTLLAKAKGSARAEVGAACTTTTVR